MSSYSSVGIVAGSIVLFFTLESAAVRYLPPPFEGMVRDLAGAAPHFAFLGGASFPPADQR